MNSTALARVGRVVRASLTNAVAHVAPRLYIQVTGERGRGEGSSASADGTAQYFQNCFAEYFAHAGVTDIAQFLAGKVVLEYGPGDLPAVAVLMIGHGAERVICVDRFPLVRFDDFSVAVLQRLLAAMSPDVRNRARRALKNPDHPADGLRGDVISYLVTGSGLSALDAQCDLVVSRAVLEHVNDLPATVRDMHAALKPGGIAVHKVDLGSHGLHERSPLDFLAWSPAAWSMMYSAKGVPNRLRVDAYRRALAATPLETLELVPEETYSLQEVAAVRGQLAAEFTGVSDSDLAWKNFWLVCRRPAGDAAGGARP